MELIETKRNLRVKKTREVEEIDNEDVIMDEHSPKNILMGSNVKMKSHTFKLDVTTMLKNVGISYKPHERQIVALEHCHIYHTFSGTGQKQYKANSIGGHYHEVEVKTDEKGNWVTKCSPPKQQLGSESIVPDDNHTHNLIYIRTGVVETNRFNPQAQALINKLWQEPNTPQGAVSR